MTVKLAEMKDNRRIENLDRHIPSARLDECIERGQVYVLEDTDDSVFGVLRYNLFWQTIPFLDLIYLHESCRGKGFGTEMMRKWECEMRSFGYEYVMTSTQADEDAWRFYEKLGYRRVGGFFPPEQDAEEWMYLKRLEK